jgi:hypothetical protein
MKAQEEQFHCKKAAQGISITDNRGSKLNTK